MNKWIYLGLNISIAIVALTLVFHFSNYRMEDSLVLQVNPESYVEKGYRIDLTEVNSPKIYGTFSVTNGTTRDIKTYVLDEINFLNWNDGYNFSVILESGFVMTDNFDFLVNRTSNYYIVFDNTFSQFPKEISLDILITYEPMLWVLSASSWVLIAWFSFVTIFAYLTVLKSEDFGSIEKIGIGLAFYVIFFLCLSIVLSVEIFEFLGIFITIINMLILIFNINLTQKNMKVQLMHSDRKKSLDKLYTILEKSKNFKGMKKNIEQFKETLDYQLLPDAVKHTVQSQIQDLNVRLSEAPDAPREPTQEQIDHHYEQMAEDHQQMTPEERFHLSFVNHFNRAKSAIRESIKDYFEEPSNE